MLPLIFGLFPLLYIQSNCHLNPKGHWNRKIWGTQTYWQYVKNSWKRLPHMFMAFYSTQNPRISQKLIKDFSFCPGINLACLYSFWMSNSGADIFCCASEIHWSHSSIRLSRQPTTMVRGFCCKIMRQKRGLIWLSWPLWFGLGGCFYFLNYYFFLITVKAQSSESKSKGVFTIPSVHLTTVYIHQITESSGS